MGALLATFQQRFWQQPQPLVHYHLRESQHGTLLRTIATGESLSKISLSPDVACLP